MNAKNGDGNTSDFIPSLFRNESDKPFTVYESTTSRVINVFLSEDIKEPKNYVELVYLIKTLNQNDILYLHLSSPGGDVETGIQIINAIRSTSGKIVTVLEAEASSMASLLFLSGHEFVIHPNTMLMFHNYSSVAIGKGHEMLSKVVKTAEWLNQLNREICYPFLTNEEIDKMINSGEDVYIYGKDIQPRLERLAQFRAEQMRKDKISFLIKEIENIQEEINALESIDLNSIDATKMKEDAMDKALKALENSIAKQKNKSVSKGKKSKKKPTKKSEK